VAVSERDKQITLLAKAVEASKSDLFFKDASKRPTSLLSKKLANMMNQNGFVKKISDASKVREEQKVSKALTIIILSTTKT